MQGYILSTQKQKNEDLIVRILTKDSIKTLYRFYGARHSVVHIGHKIDFTQEANGLFMPKLRNIIHLAFKWEREFERVYIWQRFVESLNAHLKEVYEIDSAYLEILDSGAIKLAKQNPMRAILEMYALILRQEGRNPISEQCFLCGENLGEQIALTRGFLFAHSSCVHTQTTQSLNKAKIESFLNNASTIELSDEEVARIYRIVLLGL